MSDTPLISMIAALSANDVIGLDGDMPWHISADLQYFKAQTLGKPCIMGRTTFQSILRALGKPFPARQTIILSRSAYEYEHQDVHHAQSVEEALAIAKTLTDDEIMITGGGQIYRQCLPFAQRLYLTEIDAHIEGDAFFPRFDMGEWTKTSQDKHPAGETYPAFAFTIYDRI